MPKVEEFYPSRASGSNDHFNKKMERHAAQAPALRERHLNFRHLIFYNTCPLSDVWHEGPFYDPRLSFGIFTQAYDPAVLKFN